MDIEARLVEHVVGTRYEDLPPEAVQATKDHILDTLAVVVGGSSAPGCGLLLDEMREWGGKEQSSVLAYGGKLPAASAALVNGTMGHARDFDDNHDTVAYKGSVAAVPAALAVAEPLGIDGKRFITATCIGVDLGCRIGLGIRPKPSHAYARAIGCYAAATAAGKAMSLGAQQMHDALGLAHCEVGLGGITIAAPSLTKRLGIGIAARAGVTAALLARRGYPASRDVFHGPGGYYGLYEAEEGDAGELVEELGRRYEIVPLGMKPYPCCRYTHAGIDGARAIVRDHGLGPRDIARVTVQLSPRDHDTVGGGGKQAREEALRRPVGVVDAQFSTFYTVATAIVKGTVLIEHMSESALADPDVLALAARVETVRDPSLVAADRDVHPQAVEIATQDGRRFSTRVDYPKGSPQWPMTREERRAKFWDCIAHSAVAIEADRAQEAMEIIENLETLDDMSRLAAILGPRIAR